MEQYSVLNNLCIDLGLCVNAVDVIYFCMRMGSYELIQI